MPRKTYSREDIIEMLTERLGDRPVSALAAEFGVTPQYMGKMLKGLEIPGPSILQPLKLKARKVVVYEKVA